MNERVNEKDHVHLIVAESGTSQKIIRVVFTYLKYVVISLVYFVVLWIAIVNVLK